MEKIGAENPVPPNPANSDGVATFCYTSGTTGKAKGALLTHKNMMSVIAAAYERVSQGNLNIGLCCACTCASLCKRPPQYGCVSVFAGLDTRSAGGTPAEHIFSPCFLIVTLFKRPHLGMQYKP